MKFLRGDGKDKCWIIIINCNKLLFITHVMKSEDYFVYFAAIFIY